MERAYAAEQFGMAKWYIKRGWMFAAGDAIRVAMTHCENDGSSRSIRQSRYIWTRLTRNIQNA